MKLLTQAIAKKLMENHERQELRTESGLEPIDFAPVLKLFTPDAGATWLFTEMDPADPDQVFGLCDLGLGCPELGWASLSEIMSVRGKLGLPVERDLYFSTREPISSWAARARAAGRIVDA